MDAVPAKQIPTLDEWYLEVRRVSELRELEPATIAQAESLYRNHLQAVFGSKRLDAITVGDVVDLQIAMKALRPAPFAPCTLSCRRRSTWP